MYRDLNHKHKVTVTYPNDPNASMCKEGVKFFHSVLLIAGINRISV